MKSCSNCGSLLHQQPWKFEGRAVVAEPVGEVNVLHCKLLVALEMLKELGQREEFDRLAEKFVKEKK